MGKQDREERWQRPPDHRRCGLGTVFYPTWLIEVLRCINQTGKISSFHALTVVLMWILTGSAIQIIL